MPDDQELFVVALTAELREFVVDLGEIGIDFKVDGYPLETFKKFEDAIPIVLKHLKMDYSLSAMMIVSAQLMSSKPALRSHWRSVADIFSNLASYDTRYRTEVDQRSVLQTQIANILVRSFTTEHLPTLLDMLRDPAFGDSRGVLLEPLRRRRKNEAVKAFLEKAISDPFFAKELETWKPPIT